jgi:UDP-glucuronate 4-epimerase
MQILVTGALGFIGYHLCGKLLDEGHTVYGIDLPFNQLTETYKQERFDDLRVHPKFFLIQHDLAVGTPTSVWTKTHNVFEHGFDLVYHLAASTGVQGSKDRPHEYFYNNVTAFQNILMACHEYKIPALVYASSSSVYGVQENEMSEDCSTGDQLSFYAGTKRAAEALAKSMSNHFLETKIICARFFTVYGPHGRKDMAPYIFAEKIAKGEEIELRNGVNGEIELVRDFTYIDDVIEGLFNVTGARMYGERYRTFNIGHGSPILVADFITLLERELGKKAIIKNVALPAGDVPATCASMTKYLIEIDACRTETCPEEGVKKFAEWFKSYRKDLFTV